jgi:hypothetical protein
MKKPFIISPIQQSLSNNETVIFSESFDEAIKVYAEQKQKSYTKTWLTKEEKPRNANLHNSFKIINKTEMLVFALIDNK